MTLILQVISETWHYLAIVAAVAGVLLVPFLTYDMGLRAGGG